MEISLDKQVGITAKQRRGKVATKEKNANEKTNPESVVHVSLGGCAYDMEVETHAACIQKVEIWGPGERKYVFKGRTDGQKRHIGRDPRLGRTKVEIEHRRSENPNWTPSRAWEEGWDEDDAVMEVRSSDTGHDDQPDGGNDCIVRFRLVSES
jgi:hypothetical protein